MAQERNITHKVLTDLRIPYRTFDSPIGADPSFRDGTNILVNFTGKLQRRPGFSTTLEQTASAFANLQRIFLWKRWDGTANAGYYAMFCDVAGGVAKVYRYRIGTDVSAVLIWTSTSAEPFDFVVSANLCFFGNGTDMKYFDGANVFNWGIVAPAAAPVIGLSGVSGIDSLVGYYYVYTYMRSSIGHESSPSPLSACTGIFSAKGVNVTFVPSADPQVDTIRLYRTTDGGSNNPEQMQLVGDFPNAAGPVHDVTPDTSLTTPAPPLARNDPPPPGKGFITAVNRIWYFQGNTLYYTGYEEINNGVPEMTVPGTLDGNSRPYPAEIRAVAEMAQGQQSAGVAIYNDLAIYAVEGDSLQTFVWYTLMKQRGAQNRTNVKSLGGSVVWLDTASQVWLNGDEIGVDIRTDLVGIDHSRAFIEVHIAGEHHWVLLLDGGRGKLFVYDIDTKRWYPPWPLNATTIASGLTGLGQVSLLCGLNGATVMRQVDGTYNDNGQLYSAFLKTNLFDITVNQKPEHTGVVDWVALETNTIVPSAVAQLNDDATTSAGYVGLTPNAISPFARGQGAAILKTIYPSSPTPSNTGSAAAQRVSFRIDWPADGSAFELYSIDVASHAAVSK